MVNHGNSFPYYHGLKNTIRINQDNSFLKPKRDVFWKQISIARHFVTLCLQRINHNSFNGETIYYFLETNYANYF